MNQIDQGTIHYKNEVIRKLIHFCSLSIPVIYYFITRDAAIVILSVMTFLALALDLGRYFFPVIGGFFYSLFGFLLRTHELDTKKRNLNGATYVLISALICVIIFPKVIFVTAFAILIISDSLAALIGRRFGKHKFLFKSLEGTSAFFISAIIVILLSPKIEYRVEEYILAIVAAFIGAIVENISFGYADDNLTIPLSIGFVMWLFYIIVFPEMQLILTNVPL